MMFLQFYESIKINKPKNACVIHHMEDPILILILLFHIVMVPVKVIRIIGLHICRFLKYQRIVFLYVDKVIDTLFVLSKQILNWNKFKGCWDEANIPASYVTSTKQVFQQMSVFCHGCTMTDHLKLRVMMSGQVSFRYKSKDERQDLHVRLFYIGLSLMK